MNEDPRVGADQALPGGLPVIEPVFTDAERLLHEMSRDEIPAEEMSRDEIIVTPDQERQIIYPLPGSGQYVGIGPGNTPWVARWRRKDVWGPKLAIRDINGAPTFEGVTAWEGLPGTGKTYGMVKAMMAFHAAGIPVFTNEMGFVHESGTFANFDELCDLLDQDHGDALRIVAIDEAPFWCNARKWGDFPDNFFRRLLQVRKYRYLLLFTCIRFEMVDSHLRRVTYWVWECRRTIILKRFENLLRPPSDERKVGERAVKRIRERPRLGVFDAYDTQKRLVHPGQSEAVGGPLSSSPGQIIRI